MARWQDFCLFCFLLTVAQYLLVFFRRVRCTVCEAVEISEQGIQYAENVRGIVQRCSLRHGATISKFSRLIQMLDKSATQLGASCAT